MSVMAKGSGRRGLPSRPPSNIKQFRPVSWHDGHRFMSAADYVAHLLTELGRLNLEIQAIERHERAPHTQTVLSDLLDWLSERPAEPFSKLFNWQTLDFVQMRSRLEKDRTSKPRIEISAHITKMNNLSVRWHPRGWRLAEFDWNRQDQSYSNLITHRKWREPPDFHWFSGDEEPTFNSRPSNELMYIHGVGSLEPTPRDTYGAYATYNSDVVDSILICAVRSAYEGLIQQLEHNFEVDVIDAFDFVTREEIDEASSELYQHTTHRVVEWSLEDASEVRKRRDEAAAIKQAKREMNELANLSKTYGFTVEGLIEALSRAAAKRPSRSASFDEQINRDAAKELRNVGFKVDAGKVRRIRQLVERYDPSSLPLELRSAPLDPAVSAPLPSSNIVPLRGNN